MRPFSRRVPLARRGSVARRIQIESCDLSITRTLRRARDTLPASLRDLR